MARELSPVNKNWEYRAEIGRKTNGAGHRFGGHEGELLG